MAHPQFPFRGIRNLLPTFIPNWMSNKPGLNTIYKWLYSAALLADTIIEMMFQGVRAAIPGKGTPTALPYIGVSRGMLQGMTESNQTFVSRLIQWLTYWYNAGSDEVLVKMVQSFLPGDARLGTALTVRMVDRAGHWTTIDPNGNISTTLDTSWNWDGVSNPERQGNWSDIWLFVYPDPWATWNPGGQTGPGFGWQSLDAQAQWASGNVNAAAGWGHKAPRYAIDGLLNVVRSWKAAHAYLVAVAFTTCPTLFIPGNLSSQGNPDGTWGNWGKRDPATGHSVYSRTRELTISGVYQGHVRYWTPRYGG